MLRGAWVTCSIFISYQYSSIIRTLYSTVQCNRIPTQRRTRTFSPSLPYRAVYPQNRLTRSPIRILSHIRARPPCALGPTLAATELMIMTQGSRSPRALPRIIVENVKELLSLRLCHMDPPFWRCQPNVHHSPILHCCDNCTPVEKLLLRGVGAE